MAPALLISEQDGAENTTLNHSTVNDIGLTPLCHIITPIGMLGYGFDENLTREALEDVKSDGVPTALICDSGSTDSGPEKLASGSMTAPRANYERDIQKLLTLSHEFRVPIMISSAGGDGTDDHLNVFLDIIQEICDEDVNKAYKFKTLAVYSNVSKAKVLESLRAGKVKGCGSAVPLLTEENVEAATQIVAQMGPEPFIQAMEAESYFDIVIGGRAYDPSPYVAWCVYHANKNASPKGLSNEQLGGFTHMGKIMECGALCATPKSQSSMATVYQDGSFDIKPLSPGARCTPTSVASHTLYEKTRPDILPGPGGNLNLTKSSYIQLPDDISVRVRGGTFEFSRSVGLPYTVKLEAAKVVGYRTIVMGGIRDPILISQFSKVEIMIRTHVASQVKTSGDEFWKLGFHIYGASGVMQSLEPGPEEYQPREIFLVAEVLASTQKLANSVAHTTRVGIVHGSYEGQRGTAGNFAFGVGGKTDIEMGPCGEFCVYHLMSLEEGEQGTWKMNGEKTVAKSNGKVKPTFASTLNYTAPQTLTDISPVIRSKNSGPYEITLDVVFSSPEIYEIIKSSSLLSPSTIARMYHLAEDEIIWCGFFDQALGWKCTFPRMERVKVASGSFMESDVHASQQYAGLLGLELSVEVRDKIVGLGLKVV
ncbi:uncharacterized protein LY89DRAFT_600945 [Mollisia scopiformis]|uniref:Caib baif family enzyme n=1 Tax=Mollisia scopiformis TaxID=149040 RepID=A0A132B7A7_MOLSC|nr:uncharacterized protein LY89DRAFT_600945 [Mollisia scopiformis]KUJ07764.1 hypothetical protein LY89DRAFT_600945 [Mollisia scopiformis]